MDPIDAGSEHGQLLEIAKDQAEFKTLTARVAMVEGCPEFTTRWQLSDDERAAVAAGADIELVIVTFNGWPPMRLSVAGVPAERSQVYSREEMGKLMVDLCDQARLYPDLTLGPIEDKNGRIIGWQAATAEQLAAHRGD